MNSTSLTPVSPETENSDKAKTQLPKYFLTPSQLAIYLEHMARKHVPVYVWGAMGIGKTEIIRGIAKKHRHRTVALHLSQFDPTDLKGIPVKLENGDVIWVTASYLPQQCSTVHDGVSKVCKMTFNFRFAEFIAVRGYNKAGDLVVRFDDRYYGPDIIPDGVKIDATLDSVTITTDDPAKLKDVTFHALDKAILFLDELSTAVPQVQNAALSLVQDRKINEYILPMNCPIIAAGNREIDKAHVHVTSAPLANRFNHVTLIPDVEDFIEHAYARGVMSEIIAFISWKGKDRLFNFNATTIKNGDMGFCTPRSWVNLSNSVDFTLPPAILNAMIVGWIGAGAGAEFIGFMSVKADLPNLDDILAGRVKTIDKLDLGKRWLITAAIAERMKKLYDENFKVGTPANQQSEKWKTAAMSFMEFCDPVLGREMTLFCLKSLTKRHNMSIGTILLVDSKHPVVQKFASTYVGLLDKTIDKPRT